MSQILERVQGFHSSQHTHTLIAPLVYMQISACEKYQGAQGCLPTMSLAVWEVHALQVQTLKIHCSRQVTERTQDFQVSVTKEIKRTLHGEWSVGHWVLRSHLEASR